MSGYEPQIDDGGMGRDDEPPSEEVLDLGVLDEPGSEPADRGPEPGARTPSLSRRTLLGAGGLVVIAGASALTATRGQASPPRAAAPSPPASAPPSPAGTASPTPSAPPRVAILDVRHPLLGVTAGWDLFALGEDVLLRIHPATGRITRTALPPLGDDAVSLVPARGRLLIHPTDYRQGYVVADDRPVAEMPPALNGAGPMLPGPDQDHVWVQTAWMQADGTGRRRLQLVTLAGDATGATVPVPAYVGGAVPDGAGYVLFEGVGGIYRGSPAGLSRLSGGTLVAVGRPGWLTLDCDEQARCGTILRRRDGRTHAVPVTLGPPVPPGVLSPDGRMVAVLDVGAGGDPGTTHASLVDLTSGARHALGLPLTPTGAEGILAWSPDSRWLFAIDAAAQLRAVDARTRAVTDLVRGLPPVLQLAVRT
jgi:hypothetical protein